MLTSPAWVVQFCRNLTQSFDDVYVFTVPLFLPKKDPRDGKWRVVRFLLEFALSARDRAAPPHYFRSFPSLPRAVVRDDRSSRRSPFDWYVDRS